MAFKYTPPPSQKPISFVKPSPQETATVKTITPPTYTATPSSTPGKSATITQVKPGSVSAPSPVKGGSGNSSSRPASSQSETTNGNLATTDTGKSIPSPATPNQPQPNVISSYTGVQKPYAQKNFFDRAVDFVTGGNKPEVQQLQGYRGTTGGESTYQRATGFTALQQRELINPEVTKPAVVIQQQLEEKIIKEASKEVNTKVQQKADELVTYYQEKVNSGQMDIVTAKESLKNQLHTINIQANQELNQRVNAEIPKAQQTSEFKQKLKESSSFRKDYSTYENSLTTSTEKVKGVGKFVGETAIAFVPVANVVYGARQQVKAQEAIKEQGGLFGLNPEAEVNARALQSKAQGFFLAGGLTAVSKPFSAAKAITMGRLQELSTAQYKVLGEEVARVGDTTLVKARAVKSVQANILDSAGNIIGEFPTAEAYTSITTPLIDKGGGKIAIGVSKGESQFAVEDFLKSIQQQKPVYIKGTQKFTAAGKATITPTDIENIFKQSGEGYVVTGEKVTPIKFGGLSMDFDKFYAIAGGKQRSIKVFEKAPTEFRVTKQSTMAIPNRAYTGKFDIGQFGFIKKLQPEADFGGFKVTQISDVGTSQTAQQITKQKTTQVSGGFAESVANVIEKSLSKEMFPSVSAKAETTQVAETATTQLNSLYYPEQVTKQQPKAVSVQVAKVATRELTKQRGGLINIPKPIQLPKYQTITTTTQVSAQKQLQSQKQIQKQIQQLSIPFPNVPVKLLPSFGAIDIPGMIGFGNLPQGAKQPPKISKTKPSRRQAKYTADLASAAFGGTVKVTKKQLERLNETVFSGAEVRPVLELVSEKRKNVRAIDF